MEAKDGDFSPEIVCLGREEVNLSVENNVAGGCFS